jgi:hypothetical protein
MPTVIELNDVIIWAGKAFCADWGFEIIASTITGEYRSNIYTRDDRIFVTDWEDTKKDALLAGMHMMARKFKKETGVRT